MEKVNNDSEECTARYQDAIIQSSGGISQILSIGVDFDEVVGDTMRAMLQYHEGDCCGNPMNREDVTNYHIAEIGHLKITRNEAIRRFVDFMENGHDLIQPIKGAIQKLQERKNKGHKMTLVTARDQSVVGEATLEWIQKYCPDIFDNVIFTNHFGEGKKCKGDVAKDLEIDIFLEDSPFHAAAVAERGIEVYLFNKPRSTERGDHPKITRVDKWSEIMI